MQRSLLWKEVVPFFVMFGLLLFLALITDLMLHAFNLVWIGRYLGIPGTVSILMSFIYSLRKRKLISTGSPKKLLNLHELLTWLGSLMILVHAGVHFNAILPWLATAAMLVNVISGITGKFILERARRHLATKQRGLESQGISPMELEKELLWDAVTMDLMKKWRAVHFPITLAFSLLGIAHIISIFLFWRWK